MNDYRHEVYDLSLNLLGTITEEQDQLLYRLVEVVCIHVDKSLRSGVSNGELHSTYVLACALYCLSVFRSVSADAISSFTAGTLSVSLDQDDSQLTQIANRLLANWRAPETAFLGVRA